MMIVAYFLLKTAPIHIQKVWAKWKAKDVFNVFKLIKHLLLTIRSLLLDFYILYYLIYGLTAVMGTFIHPFFFAYHLFDIVVKYPVL